MEKELLRVPTILLENISKNCHAALDAINTNSVLSGLSFNLLDDIQEDTSRGHFVRICKEISGYFSERDKYIWVSSA